MKAFRKRKSVQRDLIARGIEVGRGTLRLGSFVHVFTNTMNNPKRKPRWQSGTLYNYGGVNGNWNNNYSVPALRTNNNK